MKPAEVMTALRGHIGATCGINADRLVMKITGSNQKDPAAERKLRDVISDLRKSGIAICGHPTTGYFLPANDEELKATCDFLRSRAMSSLIQEASLKKVALPELLGQMRLEMENAA